MSLAERELASHTEGQPLLSPASLALRAWTQPLGLETPSRALSWSESHETAGRGEIILAAAATAVTSNFQEQQDQQDGSACGNDPFLAVRQWSPHSTVPKEWFCLYF